LEKLVLHQFDFNWWGERPREPNNQADSGSRGRSPHQIDTTPKNCFSTAFCFWKLRITNP
jgi:hypothetical protein